MQLMDGMNLRLAIVASVMALLLALGCTTGDEAPTATSETGATEIASPSGVTRLTAVPRILTPLPTATSTPIPPPTPTATAVPLKDCVVGLRLEPREGCSFSNNWDSFFDLIVLEGGDSILDGAVNGRELFSRAVKPDEKLCVCDLQTETDGMARIIISLPQPPPSRAGGITPWPREPDRDDCTAGMVLIPGDICSIADTYCFFDVTADGFGHFATFSDGETIDVRDLELDDKTISFSAVASEREWTIERATREITGAPNEDKSPCVADPRITDIRSEVRRGNIAAVERFLADDVDVNGRDRTGNTLLWSAVNVAKNIEMAQLLLDASADINRRDWNGDLLIGGPIWEGNLEFVKFLVEAGADVNAPDGDGSPPLRDAISRGNLEIVQYLVERGADVNQRAFGGSNLLVWALLESEEITKFLIEAGADVNGRDGSGNAVIMTAVRAEGVEGLSMLLSAGADPNGSHGSGKPALRFAVELQSSEKVQLLLEAGADVGACDANGSTALSYAILANNIELVKALVDAGANVNDFDSQDTTLLELARRVASPPIVRYLIDVGAE